MKDFSLIVAVDSKRGIGVSGRLPWHLPEDMKFFKEITLKSNTVNAVIMGRKTWMSIPEKFRPLVGRMNIVLTRTPESFLKVSGVDVVNSLDVALELAESQLADRIFVIGGSQVYAQAIINPSCRDIFLTQIDYEFGCDAFFPDYHDFFIEVERSHDFHNSHFFYRFLRLTRKA